MKKQISEYIKQSTQTGTPNEMQKEGVEGNVDALLRILEATVNVFKNLIGWQKKDGYIYQENGQKMMQQKKPTITTLLMKFLKENYSNYFSKALNTSRLIFFWSYHRLLLHQ